MLYMLCFILVGFRFCHNLIDAYEQLLHDFYRTPYPAGR